MVKHYQHHGAAAAPTQTDLSKEPPQVILKTVSLGMCATNEKCMAGIANDN